MKINKHKQSIIVNHLFDLIIQAGKSQVRHDNVTSSPDKTEEDNKISETPLATYIWKKRWAMPVKYASYRHK